MARNGYLFNLHFVGGGYAYHRADTIWESFGENMREIRLPHWQPEGVYDKLLLAIDQRTVVVENLASYDRWLLRGGWAFVTVEFARTHMPQWLHKRVCIQGILNTYTDVDVASPAALARIPHRKRRLAVLVRDSDKCVLCGARENLTMHHVKPFSIGGETTLRNLVCLCARCNRSKGQEITDQLHPDHGMVDISLVGKRPNSRWYSALRTLSENLVLTRCEVF